MKVKEDIKLKIFKSALEIYCENPMKFSVSIVAKKLKMTRAQIYKIFPSKNAILRSCGSGILAADYIFKNNYNRAQNRNLKCL